jgi:thioredoxin 1
MIYVTELNENNYDEFTKLPLVLVDIYAIWCGPCKQISPIVDSLSVDYVGKVSVGKLDADKNSSIISNLGVKSIPTILIFKDGELVERVIGMTSKNKLSDIIEKYI